jgi:hypothetical protein
LDFKGRLALKVSKVRHLQYPARWAQRELMELTARMAFREIRAMLARKAQLAQTRL